MTGQQTQNRTRVTLDTGVLCVDGKLPGNADPSSLVIGMVPSELNWDMVGLRLLTPWPSKKHTSQVILDTDPS